jgi:hypothetical protein
LAPGSAAGNVTMVWDKTPSSDDRKKIERCLKKS